MYIWTVDHQILNLDRYTRVDVVERRPNQHALSAFSTPRDSSTDPYGTLIARFNNEVDARYARCLLFKSLMDHAGVWDANAIPLLSDEWQTVKDHFKDDPEIWDLLRHSEISVTGLEEVTILYSSLCESQLPNSLPNSKKKVKEKLSEQLSIDIKWMASDDIEW